MPHFHWQKCSFPESGSPVSDLQVREVADDADADSDEPALAVHTQVRVVMSMSARRHGRRLRWIHDCVSAVPEACRGDVVRAGLKCADVFLSYRNNHPACRVLDRLLAALLPDSIRRLSLVDAMSYSLREAVVRRLKVRSRGISKSRFVPRQLPRTSLNRFKLTIATQKIKLVRGISIIEGFNSNA